MTLQINVGRLPRHNNCARPHGCACEIWDIHFWRSICDSWLDYVLVRISHNYALSRVWSLSPPANRGELCSAPLQCPKIENPPTSILANQTGEPNWRRAKPTFGPLNAKKVDVLWDRTSLLEYSILTTYVQYSFVGQFQLVWDLHSHYSLAELVHTMLCILIFPLNHKQ
jgi:hypothetical protein